ncbi:hypothetical protein SLE2022_022920 [Rubroshorea leprosula]
MAFGCCPNSDSRTVSKGWKKFWEKVKSGFSSSSNSDRRMAAPELSEKPKERKKTESTSISSLNGLTVAPELSGKLTVVSVSEEKAKERKAIESGSTSGSDDGWTVSKEWKKLSEKANATEFSSGSYSNGCLAAREQSKKQKERKTIESGSISSSPDGRTVGEEWKKLLEKAKDCEVTESGSRLNLERPSTEGLALLEKAFQSTELSSSPCREFVITAQAFKEMSTDPDETLVLGDDFHNSFMEVSMIVAADDIYGSLKDIVLIRYGFPRDKVIIRDRINSPESLTLDWSNVRRAKRFFCQLKAEVQTKSVRPVLFDYGKIHENHCLDLAGKFVSLSGMDIELIINYFRGTHVVDTLELEPVHYDHERLQNLRSLLKKEDFGFAEIEKLINMLGGVMEILSSNTPPPDLVSGLRNLGESFQMIVQMLCQLHKRVGLDTEITWAVNWKGIEDTEADFQTFSLMIRDKVAQEKEMFAWETGYKSKSNKIFAALVVMRNWVFYVDVETYRLVLALRCKISLQQLTSALRSLKERKQEMLPFVVYRILAMHSVEESGNRMRYLDEMMSSNITKSILHVVSKLDTILNDLRIPSASTVSWKKLVACEKTLQKVETKLKEIESKMHAGGEATGSLMQKDGNALCEKQTMHGGREAGTSLLEAGTSFDGRRKDKGKAPMTAEMEQNGQSSKGQGRKAPRGPGIYINDPSELQGDRHTHPTQFHKTRPRRRASKGGSSDAGCSRIV